MSVPRVVGRAGTVSVLSLLLGGVTSYAQGILPEFAAGFANSASGWTVLTVLLVAWSRIPPAPAGILGAASFVLLVLGYTVAAGLRGYTYDPLLFSVVGVVAGPFVGVATSWLRTANVRAALGTAVLAGIGIGDACYGLSVVGDTTDGAYWVMIGVVGVALLAGMLATTIRGILSIGLAVAGTAITAATLLLAYTVIGRIGLMV